MGITVTKVNLPRPVYDRLIKGLREQGEHDGRNAANWWEQDNLGGRLGYWVNVKAVAATVLKGIEDGDPKALNGLPAYANNPQPYDVYGDVCDVDDPEWDDILCQDDLYDAYRYAFDDAAIDQVAEHCRATLKEED
jgi:hypothetical protein